MFSVRTPDHVRKMNKLLWCHFLPTLRPGKGETKRFRNEARKPSHFLSEIALCEAMGRASNLQTDIEDFVPTTQPVRTGSNQAEAV